MPMHTRNILKHKYTYLAVGYTLWLTVLSLIPLNGVPLPSIHYGDKVVHFFLYFFLVVFWLLAFKKLWKYKCILFFAAVSWGVIIEFMQEYLVAHRTGDVFDALANTMGAIFGFLVFNYFRNRKE